MSTPENQKSGVFDAIPVVAQPPSSVPDEKTKAELRRLTPSEQVQVDHEALVKRLDREILGLRSAIKQQGDKIDSLRVKELELEALREERSWKAWISMCSGVAAIVGGGLISSSSFGKIFLGLGWGFVIIAAILLLFSSFAVDLLRPKAP